MLSGKGVHHAQPQKVPGRSGRRGRRSQGRNARPQLSVAGQLLGTTVLRRERAARSCGRAGDRGVRAWTPTRSALAIASGPAALHCALAAFGIGPGDEVILPAWTWHSCFNTIVLSGALPVFAEIDESFNLDHGDFEAKITPQTKLVMAVHLQGCPADLDRIIPIARRHGVKVLEDRSE